MDGHRFDQITKQLVAASSRRQALRTLMGGLVATLAGLQLRDNGVAQTSCGVCSRCRRCNCEDPDFCFCDVTPDATCFTANPCTDGVCDELGDCIETPVTGRSCTPTGGGTGTCLNGICCPSGQINCGGQCATCPQGPTRCEGTACVCNSGLRNCSGVCTTCPSGGQCSGTNCVCPSGQTNCGGTCVDLKTDPHCGVCGTNCPDTSICAACKGDCTGQAVAQCCPTTKRTNCGGTCTNLRTDEANCGRCGKRCRRGKVCKRGTCV
jgi:hypothetical protein